jgi:hypothetical protein
VLYVDTMSLRLERDVMHDFESYLVAPEKSLPFSLQRVTSADISRGVGRVRVGLRRNFLANLLLEKAAFRSSGASDIRNRRQRTYVLSGQYLRPPVLET